MRRLLLLLVLSVLLTGCSTKLSFTDVNIKDADKAVQEFVDSI